MIKDNNGKKKIIIYLVTNLILSIVIVNFINSNLMNVVYDYGKYQCNNLMTNIITHVVNTQVNDSVQKNIIVENDEKIIDVNVAVLNSITCNVILKSKQMLYELETGQLSEEMLKILGKDINENNIKRGIIYEIPLGSVFNNLFVSNLGVSVPVKYKLIGEVSGQIVSTVKEYGINNSLIEIGVEIIYRSKISVPMISGEEENTITIPLVMKIIQGKVPDYLLGTNILGGK